jgi:hypothetical protein
VLAVLGVAAPLLCAGTELPIVRVNLKVEEPSVIETVWSPVVKFEVAWLQIPEELAETLLEVLSIVVVTLAEGEAVPTKVGLVAVYHQWL